MTKPMVVVTKHRDPRHLHRRDEDVLYLDALSLAEELEAAYFQRVKLAINGDFRTNMESRFREFQETHWNDRAIKKNHLHKAPLRGVMGVERRNISTQVNSPSAQTVYHTNISTTGFDDPNQ